GRGTASRSPTTPPATAAAPAGRPGGRSVSPAAPTRADRGRDRILDPRVPPGEAVGGQPFGNDLCAVEQEMLSRLAENEPYRPLGNAQQIPAVQLPGQGRRDPVVGRGNGRGEV